MAAVSPWFATTRMLIEIRTLRARLVETTQATRTLPVEESARLSAGARPLAAR